jgi:TetR/AcrR family tetracycline transcriptional repressor
MDRADVGDRRDSRLTRKRIVDAALAVIDEDGLPALNMRRLGTELGVKAMAVYRHFPSKDAILDGIVESVLRELPESTAERDWRAGFRSTFLELRGLLRRHPNALPLAASRPLSSPQLARRLESTRDQLLEAGLPEVDALHLLHAGMSLTLGYLWLEAGGFVGELPDEAPFLRRTSVGAGAAADGALGASAAWSRDQDFTAGLDLLIANLGGGHQTSARGPG